MAAPRTLAQIRDEVLLLGDFELDPFVQDLTDQINRSVEQLDLQRAREMVLPEGCLQSGFGVVRHRDPAHVQGAVLEADLWFNPRELCSQLLRQLYV